jgi:hypothetical protein
MERKVFIYSLEYPKNNIRYIGKTINLKQRLKRHIYDSECKTTSKKLAWIRSLLKQNIRPLMNIIDIVEESDSNFWEIHYIALYKSFGFNLTNNTFGGDGQSNPTLEVRNSISEKIKLRAKIKGVWNKGILHTEEEKLNLSLGHKNREEVLQYDLKGNFVKSWNSRNQIKRELGFDNMSIGKCCKGEFNSCNGYVWIYKKDINSIQERIQKALSSPKVQKHLI